MCFFHQVVLFLEHIQGNMFQYFPLCEQTSNSADIPNIHNLRVFVSLTHSAPGIKLYKGGSTKHGYNE